MVRRREYVEHKAIQESEDLGWAGEPLSTGCGLEGPWAVEWTGEHHKGN